MGAPMGALYRLKAYFGMVPAAGLAEYSDEHEPEPRARESASRWDDRYATDDDRYDGEASWERRPARTTVVERSVERVSSPASIRAASPAPVRGALAIDPDSVRLTAASGVPEQRERPTGAAALA